MREPQIDELYRLPLDEFIDARDALARTLGGAEAGRVRKLAKPTLVSWTVNHVYWNARPIYDRLLKNGERLRQAQIAALGGRAADVRGAADGHRRALADAVKEAERLAAAGGAHPDRDGLVRTLEALSLSSAPSGSSEPHGRLMRPLPPAGFETLAGVTPRPGPKARPVRPEPDRPSPPASSRSDARLRRWAEAEARRHERALRKAEAALERAHAAEASARAALEKATRDVAAAQEVIAFLRKRPEVQGRAPLSRVPRP